MCGDKRVWRLPGGIEALINESLLSSLPALYNGNENKLTPLCLLQVSLNRTEALDFVEEMFPLERKMPYAHLVNCHVFTLDCR